MYYNIHYEICAILIVLVLLFSRSKYFKSDNKAIKQFIGVLMMVIATCCMNITAALAYSNIIRVSDQGLLVIETIYLIFALLSCYMQLGVIRERFDNHEQDLKLVNLVILSVAVIALVFNISLKYIFTYENHQFVGYLLFYGVYVVYALLFIEMGVLIFQNRDKVRSGTLITSASIMFLPVICILVQMIYDELLLSELGAAIAFLLYNYSLEDEDYEKYQETLLELESSKEGEQKNRADITAVNRVKNIFMKNVSGELRVNITDVLEFDNEIQDKELSPQAREYTNQINESAKQLLNYVDSLTKAGENNG